MRVTMPFEPKDAVALAFACVIVSALSMGCAGTSVADAAASGATQGTAQKDSQEAALAQGRRLTTALYDGQLDELFAQFSPEVAEAVPLWKLKKLQEQMAKTLGKEKSVLSEEAMGRMGTWRYRRLVQYERFADNIQVEWIFKVGGTIESIRVGPPVKLAPTRYPSYKTKTVLRLPFEGAWTVFWGGHTLDQNYHAAYRDQRFAYDLLVMQGDKSHRGDGSRLDDYYAYGKKVLAPGAGVVVAARGDLSDNPIGTMDRANPMGNHVIIDHGNGEFSFLAHLQQGSVHVSTGTRVESGQLLGLCGNSGNTSEPHIHYHVQDTGVFAKGWGLPAQFRLYRADGEPVQNGELLQGQVVSPGEGLE